MALRGQSPIKWLLVLLCFTACQADPPPTLEDINGATAPVLSKGGFYFLDGKLFSGSIYLLHANQKDTASIKQFIRGKKDGTWRYWYPEGQIKEIRYYGKGQKQGDYIGYFENGKKSFHYQFKDNVYEGNNRSWNRAGRLIQNQHYINGQEEGLQQIWYDDGRIKSNYIMREGRRYGLLGTKNCINVADSLFVD